MLTCILYWIKMNIIYWKYHSNLKEIKKKLRRPKEIPMTDIVSMFFYLQFLICNISWTKQSAIYFHLGMTWVIVLGTEVIWWLVDASETFSLDCVPLSPVEVWKKPGGVSSFSLSRMSLESISMTWLIIGLRFAFDWVQKKATLMYLRTSSWGNPSISGSTNSNILPSSYSCHACLSRSLVYNQTKINQGISYIPLTK